MKTGTLTTAIGLLLLFGFGAVSKSVRTEGAALEAQAQELRGTRDRLNAELAARRESASAAAKTAPALSLAERNELLKLRGEVGRLRERRKELAGVQAQHAAIRTRAEQARAAERAFVQSLPPGYVLRRDAQFAGYATPEATLQTLVWAIEQGDTNALGQAMMFDRLPGAGPGGAGAAPARFLAEAKRLPGFRVLGKETLPDGTVQLRVEWVPGDGGTPMRAVSEKGFWRLLP